MPRRRRLATIERAAGRSRRAGLLDGAAAADVRGRMLAVPTLERRWPGADWVQENTPEDLDDQAGAVGRLDRLADRRTHPRELHLGDRALAVHRGARPGRDRCLVCHPINPPYLIPAVELVPAPWTRPRPWPAPRRSCAARPGADRHAAGARRLRHEPDAGRAARGGVPAGRRRLLPAEDVDIGLKEGLALRWSFMGPFETIDLNAPAACATMSQRYQPIYERLFPSMQRRVDWAGPVHRHDRAERRAAPAGRPALPSPPALARPPADGAAAHKRAAAHEIGE